MFRLRKSLVGLWIVVVLMTGLYFTYFMQTTHAGNTGIWQVFTYSSSQGSRIYYVYTPVNYHRGTPVPMIVMLHGCTQTAADFAAGTQIDTLADQKQFIVVYPQQSSSASPLACWNWFQLADQYRNSGEAQIIAGITQTVEQNTSQWTINMHRVYLAGMSAGATFASIMGATYPDLYAAIGVHSGLEYQAATNTSGASQAQLYGGPNPASQGAAAYNAMGNYARLVPVIVFHGTLDAAVNPINGDQVIQQWMVTDHDASGGSYNANFYNPSSTTHGQAPGGYSYTVRRWNESSRNEIEEYWTINGMGHAWSGGSIAGTETDPNGPSATNAMYAFFMKHTL